MTLIPHSPHTFFLNSVNLCVIFVQGGYANLLCIIQILVYVLRKGAPHTMLFEQHVPHCVFAWCFFMVRLRL